MITLSNLPNFVLLLMSEQETQGVGFGIWSGGGGGTINVTRIMDWSARISGIAKICKFIPAREAEKQEV